MKHLKTTLTSLLLISSALAWASGPTHTNTILREDSIFESEGTNATDLAQYGISTVWYKRMQYGVNIGFNFTSNPSFLQNTLFGIAFGGTATLPFTANWAVRLGLLYTQDVFSGEQSIDAMPTTYLNRLSFFDIPIMIRYQPSPDLNLAVLAGGDFMLSLGSGYSYAAATGPTLTSTTKPSSTAFGYTFGIEYSLFDVTGCFRVIGDVPDNGNLPSAKTLVGQFTLAYTFQTAQ